MTSIHGRGPTTYRVLSHRPLSRWPMSGKASRRARTRATRSGVSGGRLWVSMSSARSAAAAGATMTLATNGARELIERDAFAGADLAPAQLRALVRAGDAVEQGDDVARVGVGLVDGR